MKAKTLMDVWVAMQEDDRLDGYRPAGIHLVPGDGDSDAPIMVVGEAPGATENGAMRPFCGVSGRVLDQLMDLGGMGRPDVYITNVVKYRPPGNATPTPKDIAAFLPYLRAEWRIIRPFLTIAVGSIAHKALRPAAPSISEVNRGQVYEFPDCPGRYVTSQFHPAYGLRNVSARPGMESEWKKTGAWLVEYMEVHYRG